MKVVVQRPPFVNCVFEARLRELKLGSGWFALEGLRALDEPYREGLPFLHKGYFDSHLHLSWLGAFDAAIDLRGCRSPAELVARVNKKLESSERSVLRGFGWSEDEMGVPLASIEKVFRDRLPEAKPLLLERVCGHAALVNNSYLNIAKWPGEKKCFVEDRTLIALRKALPKPTCDEISESYLKGQKLAIEHGISAVGEMSIDASRFEALVALCEQGALALDFCGVLDGGAIPELEKSGPRVIENRHPVGPMDRKARIHFSHWKKFLDGSLGARSAWLSRAYNDAEVFGESLQKTKDLIEQSEEALKNGFYLSFHAIGDAAVDQALEVGRVLKTQMKALVSGLSSHAQSLHRIEHAQVLRDDQLATLKEQGFWCIAAQPHHRVADEPFINQRLGKERLEKMGYRAAAVLKQRIPFTVGSDSPIDVISPAKAIQALCMDAREQERLTLDEALWCYTTGGRLALGLDPGILEKGSTVYLTEPATIF